MPPQWPFTRDLGRPRATHSTAALFMHASVCTGAVRVCAISINCRLSINASRALPSTWTAFGDARQNAAIVAESFRQQSGSCSVGARSLRQISTTCSPGYAVCEPIQPYTHRCDPLKHKQVAPYLTHYCLFPSHWLCNEREETCPQICEKRDSLTSEITDMKWGGAGFLSVSDKRVRTRNHVEVKCMYPHSNPQTSGYEPKTTRR